MERRGLGRGPQPPPERGGDVVLVAGGRGRDVVVLDHRSPTALLPELLPEQQVRRSDPAALLAAVLVPVLAVSAWSARDEQPWGVAYVMGVVAVVVVLSAIRHVALAR